MKLAVLGDIHSNFVALQTVVQHLEQWQPDRVVVAGDMVNRGPRPLECLQFVQRKQKSDGWLVVRGNHEDYVMAYDDPQTPRSGPEFEIFQTAYWTYQQLNGHVTDLKAMPFQVDLSAPDGSDIRVVHASMRNNRDGIFPKTTHDQIRDKIEAPGQSVPKLFCTAHTHCPLTRLVDGTLVVNVGAVGLPFDGDLRAAYAQLTWRRGEWQVDIIRLDYDRAQAEQDFYDSGYLANGGPLIELVLDEFHAARPNLYQWTLQYHQQIVAGDITLEQSVHNYLSERKYV